MTDESAAIDQLSDRDAERLLVTVLQKAGITARYTVVDDIRPLLECFPEQETGLEPEPSRNELVRLSLRLLRDNGTMFADLADSRRVDGLLRDLRPKGEVETFARDSLTKAMLLLIVLRALSASISCDDQETGRKISISFEGEKTMDRPGVEMLIRLFRGLERTSPR